jgi:hypothetical protein
LLRLPIADTPQAQKTTTPGLRTLLEMEKIYFVRSVGNLRFGRCEDQSIIVLPTNVLPDRITGGRIFPKYPAIFPNRV